MAVKVLVEHGSTSSATPASASAAGLGSNPPCPSWDWGLPGPPGPPASPGCAPLAESWGEPGWGEKDTARDKLLQQGHLGNAFLYILSTNQCPQCPQQQDLCLSWGPGFFSLPISWPFKKKFSGFSLTAPGSCVINSSVCISALLCAAE